MKKILCMLMAVLFIAVTGCTPRTVTRSTVMLDTVATFTLYNSENISIINQTLSLCKKYESLLSKTVVSSDIGKLNSAGGKPVAVSQDTLSLLTQAIEYAKLSDGLFDVTIQPAAALWDFKAEKPALPDAKLMTKALPKIGYQNIVIEGNTVTLKNGAQIDLGGIAKGYIADQAAAFIRQSGVSNAIVDMGGNLVVLGQKSEKELFQIGIRKPFDTTGAIIGTLSVTNKAVVTSGIYERYFELEGKRYYHILDPRTGYPCTTDLISATVIGDDSTQCDAMSTICILLGLDEGMELICEQGLDALFITSDNTIIVSPGFTQKYNPQITDEYKEYIE